MGSTADVTIAITNVGQGPLQITAIQLDYAAEGAVDDKGPAFSLVEPPSTPFEVLPIDSVEGTTRVELTVRYLRNTAFSPRVAILSVSTGSKRTPVASVLIQEESPAAVGSLTPEVVDFGTVEKGTVATRIVKVQNTGTDVLVCDAFKFRGHPDLTLHVDDDTYPVSEVSLEKTALSEPFSVGASQTKELKVTFAPTTESPAEGELTIYCNDLAGLDGHVAVLLANQNVPCIEVTPGRVEFGGKIIGQKATYPVKMCSCGGATLRIKNVSLALTSAPDYSVGYAPAGLGPTGFEPDAPIALEINECITVDVEYVPDVVNPLDADNKPIPDVGTLLVDNDSFDSTVEIQITGIGLEGTCPVPVITIQEGEQVVPQTTLHLDSTQSYSPNGSVTKQEWDVILAPEGNVQGFIPDQTFDKPIFTANLAGLYRFQLGVRDEANKRSGEDGCDFATYDVLVIPDEAIHVELVWTTPGDPLTDDEGEGAGADLDLHFAHPFATGPLSPNPDIDGDTVGDPWFDTDFDTFWYNGNPNWGAFSPEADDDPSLDRDDIDGWGPENLNLNVPEEASTYHIGVHYWNDYGFGVSIATVRVYIYGTLDVEVKDVALNERDMWYVGVIPWVAGTGKTQLYEDAGAKRITPGYLNPAFVPGFNSN